MGYLVAYTIDTDDPSSRDQLMELFINNLDGYDPTVNECKWYEMETDCKEVSLVYPHLIVVTCRGEDGEVWKDAYQNGKCVWHWQLDYTIPTMEDIIQALRSATKP